MHCDYRGDAAQTVTSTRPFCAAEGGQGGSGGPGELCDNSCADAVPGAAHLISYSMYKTALTPDYEVTQKIKKYRVLSRT